MYGSLRRGAPGGMARLMQPGSRRSGLGRVRGRLLDLGAYPGLVPGTTGWVVGELHQLLDAPGVLERLDRYEGCGPADPPPHEFARVVLPVRTAAGLEVPAWVYVYRGATAGRPAIPSGDYLAHLRGRHVL